MGPSKGIQHLISCVCAACLPKVCPIRVLVLLGSVRPCSLPPVRTLPFKTQKKKKCLSAPVCPASVCLLPITAPQLRSHACVPEVSP
jgi:hypothetical protein